MVFRNDSLKYTTVLGDRLPIEMLFYFNKSGRVKAIKCQSPNTPYI